MRAKCHTKITFSRDHENTPVHPFERAPTSVHCDCFECYDVRAEKKKDSHRDFKLKMKNCFDTWSWTRDKIICDFRVFVDAAD